MFGLIQAVSSLQTIDFGVFLNAVKLPSDAAQRPNAGAFSATGGPFSNDTRAGWSLRVAGGGEAVKDSSPGGGEHNSFLLALEREKSQARSFFCPKGNIFDRKLETWQPGELAYDTERREVFDFFFFFFFPLVKVNGSRKMTSCETKVLCNHCAVIRDLIRYSDVTALPAVSRQHISPSATKLPRMSP